MLGIGFDSGGSRTTYALDLGGGPQLREGNESAVSLADARGAAAASAAIEWMVDVIKNQSDDDIVAWIGAAGFSAASAPAIQARFREPLRALAAELEEEGRRCEVFIANDAVSLLKAPPLLGTGMAAVVGTGSVVIGAHPKCPTGVVQRGGYEWLVSDEGSAVWMTLQCVRMVLRDIQARGSQDYHSVLLERLADFLGIPVEATLHIPLSHRALARADLVARRISESRPDAKRWYASFAYPHIFDLATRQPGSPYDPLAAEVLRSSVEVIAESVRMVSDELAAYTADEPNLREPLALIVGGKIAAHAQYNQQLQSTIAGTCRFVSSVTAIGDGATSFAALAARYLASDRRRKAQIAQAVDPLHPIYRLL
ncbi:MAG: hypothetical protein ACR2H2_08385 [Solirubrobacteraceae bacterium]